MSRDQSYAGNPEDFDADDEWLNNLLDRNQADKDRDTSERQSFMQTPPERRGETVDNSDEVERAQTSPPSAGAVARAGEAQHQRDWDYLNRKENETLSALDPNHTDTVTPAGGHLAALARLRESLGRSAETLKKEPDLSRDTSRDFDADEEAARRKPEDFNADEYASRHEQMKAADAENMGGIRQSMIDAVDPQGKKDMLREAREQTMRNADRRNMEGIRGALKNTTAGLEDPEKREKRGPMSIKELRDLLGR